MAELMAILSLRIKYIDVVTVRLATVSSLCYEDMRIE
jgi:hypothetical protein